MGLYEKDKIKTSGGNMDKFKKKLLAVSLFIALASTCLVHPHYEGKYELLEGEDAFAKCSCGTIYIGDIQFLRSIPKDSCVILVEDGRFSEKDPNMRIYSSCEIRSNEDRKDVLAALMEYERQDPSPWDRSMEAMGLEWTMHNLSYDISYETGRTESVDLNNKDEERYDNKLLQLLFGVR